MRNPLQIMAAFATAFRDQQEVNDMQEFIRYEASPTYCTSPIFDSMSFSTAQKSGIPMSIHHRGKGRGMRPSRSKYSPVQEDRKHNIN